MDPDAAYEEMTEAYRRQEWGAAFEAAHGLINWLRRGGFPPSDHTRAEARITAGLIYVESREAERVERRERRRRKAR